MIGSHHDAQSLLAEIQQVPMTALDQLARLYTALNNDIAQRKPICEASGRCCHFDTYGHRLYVSTLELAYFVSHTASHVPDEAKAGTVPWPALATPLTFPLPLFNNDSGFQDGCPWQIDGLCTARDARPLGCRIYFCDTTAEEWQRERYEFYHQKMTQLHITFGVPYYYMEWRMALSLISDRSAR
jgi:Fe-S-cluster containining protein